jgi:hypothetical protein
MYIQDALDYMKTNQYHVLRCIDTNDYYYYNEHEELYCLKLQNIELLTNGRLNDDVWEYASEISMETVMAQWEKTGVVNNWWDNSPEQSLHLANHDGANGFRIIIASDAIERAMNGERVFMYIRFDEMFEIFPQKVYNVGQEPYFGGWDRYDKEISTKRPMKNLELCYGEYCIIEDEDNWSIE